MKSPPLLKLQDRSALGLDIQYWTPHRFREQLSLQLVEKLPAHRDDNYLFIVQKTGQSSIRVDGTTQFLSGSVLFFVRPGQVHEQIRMRAAAGWFMGVLPTLLPTDCRAVLDDLRFTPAPCPLAPVSARQIHGVLRLLHAQYTNDSQPAFSGLVLHGLLTSFIGLAARCCASASHLVAAPRRPNQLVQAFRTVLTDCIRTKKSPAAYAAALHVTPGHLNAVVQQVTGASVSYWIRQEAIWAAQRILYYEELTVKEIAYELGYDDPAYFTRLFKKGTGLTPLAYRKYSRELS